MKTPTKMWRDPRGKPCDLYSKRYYPDLLPVLLIPCDAESLADLRENVAKVVLHASWPKWQRLEVAERVLKSLGLPVRPAGKKKGSAR